MRKSCWKPAAGNKKEAALIGVAFLKTEVSDKMEEMLIQLQETVQGGVELMLAGDIDAGRDELEEAGELIQDILTDVSRAELMGEPLF